MNAAHPTIALVAGEASGDQLGGALLKELKIRYPDARFVGIGGDQMRAQEMETWWDYQELAVMGLFEVLEHFPRLYKLRRQLRQRLLDLKPDLFIGIDAPDFNLGLEIALRKRDISTVHYVSPTVWAWRSGRVKKIARAARLVLCLFPFEPAWYREQPILARYVGHPMADQIEDQPDRLDARTRLGLSVGDQVVALLPGSRESEVSRLASPMIESARIMADRRPDLRFVTAIANKRVRSVFEREMNQPKTPPIELIDGQSRDVMAAADAVVVASGTAALETMLVNRPMVVCYRMAPSSYRLVKYARLLKSRYVSLPNILANEQLVPELLQDEANGLRIAEETLAWLGNDHARAELQSHFSQLHEELRCNAGLKAAESVISLLDSPS